MNDDDELDDIEDSPDAEGMLLEIMQLGRILPDSMDEALRLIMRMGDLAEMALQDEDVFPDRWGV